MKKIIIMFMLVLSSISVNWNLNESIDCNSCNDEFISKFRINKKTLDLFKMVNY